MQKKKKKKAAYALERELCEAAGVATQSVLTRYDNRTKGKMEGFFLLTFGLMSQKGDSFTLERETASNRHRMSAVKETKLITLFCFSISIFPFLFRLC